MSKREKEWLRLCNRMLSGLLALLGFSSCGEWGGEAPCEYGQPYAKFEVKGKVVADDAGQDRPMKGTRVIVKSVEKDAMLPDTLYTEETGEYLFKDDSAWPKMTYRVVCEDPDGIYKADSVDVKMTPTGGDGNWYGGSDSKEVNFKLTKKKDS